MQESEPLVLGETLGLPPSREGTFVCTYVFWGSSHGRDRPVSVRGTGVGTRVDLGLKASTRDTIKVLL